jgi:hypothetical protein
MKWMVTISFKIDFIPKMQDALSFIRLNRLAELVPWNPFLGSIKVYNSGSGVRLFWARIFKRLWSPGIGSMEWIPPAYVAWLAGTITLFLLSS